MPNVLSGPSEGPGGEAGPGETVVQLLNEMFEASNLGIGAEARGEEEGHLRVELTGEDAEAVFGNNGKALDSLQFLTNLMGSRRHGRPVRVFLDAAGYRARREATLNRLAREFADQVRDRQEECELEPLPPHERRIVHRALTDEPGIRTFSEGEEPDRRIVIAPKAEE
jgi:spoIIIJ-associated protein